MPHTHCFLLFIFHALRGLTKSRPQPPGADRMLSGAVQMPSSCSNGCHSWSCTAAFDAVHSHPESLVGRPQSQL